MPPHTTNKNGESHPNDPRLGGSDGPLGGGARARNENRQAMPPALAHTDAARPPPKRECRHPGCDTWGAPETFPTTDYCSEACQTRHAGRELLLQFVRDHRYCSTCYRKLKSVEHPPDDLRLLETGAGWTRDDEGRVTVERYGQEESREALIGYQYRTPAATTGERVRRDDIQPPVIGTGLVCGGCGSTGATGPPDAYQDPIIEAAGLFIDAARREDVATCDPATVFDVLVDTGDLELAIGRGCEQT